MSVSVFDALARPIVKIRVLAPVSMLSALAGGMSTAIFGREVPIQLASFYDAKMTRLSGEVLDMSEYRGKVLAVVNVACF